MEFVDDVEITIVDSIVVTGIPSVDSLNVDYQVTGAESLFVRAAARVRTQSFPSCSSWSSWFSLLDS
jgi:hypothetical protein